MITPQGSQCGVCVPITTLSVFTVGWASLYKQYNRQGFSVFSYIRHYHILIRTSEIYTSIYKESLNIFVTIAVGMICACSRHFHILCLLICVVEIHENSTGKFCYIVYGTI
jgi:hypothetical protein